VPLACVWDCGTSSGCGLAVLAVTGSEAFCLALACECLGVRGGAETLAVGVFAGALPAVSTRAAPPVVLPWPSAAAYTPAAAMAKRAASAIAAVVRPVRKLISSRRALTAARRPGWVRIP
jgi:hypothetical protein